MSDKQMQLEMLMDEFGVEGDYVEEVKTVTIPDDYLITNITELYDGDIIEGKPELSDIITSEFENDDGEKEISHRVELGVVNDTDEEVTIIRINLKSGDDIQKNVHAKSKLFLLVKGLMEMKCGAGCFDQYNRLKSISIDKIQSMVNDLDFIKMKVKEESAGTFEYNSFVVLNPELDG